MQGRQGLSRLASVQQCVATSWQLLFDAPGFALAVSAPCYRTLHCATTAMPRLSAHVHRTSQKQTMYYQTASFPPFDMTAPPRSACSLATCSGSGSTAASGFRQLCASTVDRRIARARFSTTAAVSSSDAWQVVSSSEPVEAGDAGRISLSNLNAGGRKYRRRRARGGGDKQAGRGMNGTGKPSLFFEGGQTPMWKRLPKRGAHNPFSYTYDSILLADVDAAIRRGRLDPSRVITMKHLYDAGLMEKKAYNRNGAAIIAVPPGPRRLRRLRRHAGLPQSLEFEIPIELEVARISKYAQQAVEAAGGRVTKVFYNQLGMRALLLPKWFEKKGRLLPRAVQVVPFSKRWRYDRPGTLPPPDAPALPELEAATA